MKYPLATSVLLSLLLVSSCLAAADVPDPGKPAYANGILGGFKTPTVAPGQRVDFSFNITNPYNVTDAVMQNLSLVVGIYMYATQEKAEPVTTAFPHPPMFHRISTEWEENISEIQTNQTWRISLPIYTTHDTPHGSYFSQSTYFVRFNLTFNFPGNSTTVVLKSKGWFSEEEWSKVVSFAGNEGIVNRTYLKSLGVDGLLPDSSFGVKIPIPRWPLGVMVAFSIGLTFVALYSFVLDNPGRFPRLEKRFYYLRGKLRESWSKLKNGRRK